MNELTIEVPGIPVPQGSMKAIKSPHAKFASVIATNKKQLDTWRGRVATAASLKWCRELLDGPVAVGMRFSFPRPKGHFGTGRNAGKLKDSAPTAPIGRKNDCDKLIRAILDALTGVVFQDDGQVVNIHAYKCYGDPPMAEIQVMEL